MDELLELRNQEDAIRDQADTWYRRWCKSLDRHGHEDEYWSRVIQIGEDFADKHGDCGKYLIVARMQLIEKVWREHLGIAYSGLLDGMEQEEEKEVN